MSLQFILGSSGSGKTEYIYRKIVKEAAEHPKKNYLVLVPEQFTMQTQKKLVELAQNHAIMNIDVLSFKRLAYRVFDELGMTQVRVLEETGKNLVLRRLAQEQEDKLTVLRPNMNRMGYIGEVKSLISELVQYNITPEQLSEFAGKKELSPVLRAKLSDVYVMYQAFTDFMRGNYVTAEEILHVLKGCAGDSRILKNSVMVLDEFTGFTPIQNNLLRELLPITERMYVTLTVDAGEDFYHSRGNGDLFELSKKTIASLMRMAEEVHTEVLDPIVLTESEKKRFVHAPALAFMEQNLFRPRYAKMEGKVREIHLQAARSPKEELTLVARQINGLIREGYRYREIAVVTGSVESYECYIEPLFAKYQIPYFMDTTKEVLFHPFIECIRAALEIMDSNYSYEAVMRFLRCGFCGIEEEELDRLDNYLLAVGIRGRRAWGKRWDVLPMQKELYDLDRMERLRQQIFGVLEPLCTVFSQKDSCVRDGILALYQLMVTLEVEKQLWEREKILLEKNEQTKSKEYGQIYPIVMQLLEKYNALLGDEPLRISDFTEVLEAGLSAAVVAVIPPGYDSVTIGDIERTRLNHIKVLFFVGVNDGIIPKATGAGGIISEYERQQLLAADMELAPGAREQAFIQRFYLYRNLTKPSEQLYISFAKTDREGKAIRPSYLIGTIRKLFPNLELAEYEDVETNIDFYTKEAAVDYLIRGERGSEWYALAKWFFHAGETEKRTIEKLLEAAYKTYRGEPISKGVALAMYGRKPRGSVTRLEQFAACAYAHYLQYGLQLREREESDFRSVDIGNLYHMALERYSQKVEQSSYDWFTLPDEKRVEFSEASMEEAFLNYPNMGIYASAENAYQAKRMIRIFSQTVWALTKQVRAGQFVPKEFEISFSEITDIDALQISLDQNVQMNLNGRIDRLDSYDEGNYISIKVIDYKSGGTKFDLIRIYRGLQLQLAVYLNAATELISKKYPNREIVPGGILYYHIDDPVLETDGSLTEEEARQALLMALRPDGLVNEEEEIYRAMDEDLEGKSMVIPLELKKSGEISRARSHVATTEEFGIIGDYAKLKMEESGLAIYDGDVRVNPYREGTDCSCNFCPYAAVCGMDLKIPGYGYRHPESLSKEDVLERMETDLARNRHAKKEQEGRSL